MLGFLHHSCRDVTGEVAAVLLVEGLVDPLRKKVPITPGDYPLTDEYDYLAETLKFFLIAGAFGLITPEARGMIDE